MCWTKTRCFGQKKRETVNFLKKTILKTRNCFKFLTTETAPRRRRVRAWEVINTIALIRWGHEFGNIVEPDLGMTILWL
jgi:hypothetical protein